ncbi:MAG: prolipoprotein diacylglyceryl transferase [Nanoarchaeota archaeon]|nr:prolipoprotein diacylglyceryl transferase [Nanoarchaeota archaeon]
MPFIHNFNPTLVHLGPFEIRYYGLVYVLAFVIVYFYFRHLMKHKRLKLSEEELYDFILYNMLGVLIGSRLIHIIFWEPMYYLQQPWKVLYVWEGGMAFHGGLIGVAVATYLFWRKIGRRISFAKLGDYLSMPAIFMLAIGRIANFINGELPGRVTDVSWCWYFPGYDGCRHPQQLYSAIKRFIVFGWLVFVNTRKHKDGFVLWNMVTLIGIGRFVIDFYRDDPTLLGLTAGQYLSMVMFVLGAYVLVRYYMDDVKRLFGMKV